MAVSMRDVSTGRDNNLNLIRILAAQAVLVSHAWPIALGAGTPEPLSALTGIALGTQAVIVFFVLSGFLIAMSFERATSRTEFVLARALRLVPGLLVSLLAVAFGLGLWVTTLPAAAYLTDGGTYTFLVRNLALISPQYTLPGVFEANPYPTVEGSIWTLFHEVACYGGVFAMGVLGLLARRGVGTAVLLAGIGLWLALALGDVSLHPKLDQLLRLAVPFALGMLAWLWRDRLPVSAWIAGALVAAVLALALIGAPRPLYDLGYVAALGYAALWLGFVPRGPWLAYNRVGDYSYGLYIYAFPMQGLAVWIWGPQSPAWNIAAATLLTLPCAIASWHLIERPALGGRKPLAAWVLGRTRLSRS